MTQFADLVRDGPGDDGGRLLNAAIALIAVVVLLVALLSDWRNASAADVGRVALCAALLLAAGGSFLLRRAGLTTAAGALLVATAWIGATAFLFGTGLGLHSAVAYLYLPIIVFASLVLGLASASVVTALTLVALTALWWAEETGRIEGLRLFLQQTSNFNFLLGIAAACLGSLVIAAVYQRTVQLALSALEQSRSQLAATNSSVLVANQNLEQRVAERTRELEQKVDELEAFSYSVAHDLRTPLRTINALATRARDEHGAALDDGGRRLIAQIPAETLRMDALLMGLLELSRIGRAPLTLEAVNLSGLAQRVAREAAPSPEGARVKFTIAPGLTVCGDAVLLQTVLESLFDNAVKFTRHADAPQVEFGFDPTREGGAFYVRDNGAGFDPEHMRQLFRPFHRLHGMDEFEGIGLGLASAQRIVRRHGGRIWGESAPGRGATFWFTLPAT